MPIVPTYPGVYVEEVPSGVRTIAGVSTSVTAFVGRLRQGGLDPALVTSFTEFERIYGGLVVDIPLSYAVRDFFVNGGNQALIARAYKKPATGSDVATSAPLKVTVGGTDIIFQFSAANPGTWANSHWYRLSALPDSDLAARLGVPIEQVYRLDVCRGPAANQLELIESHIGVTLIESSRRLDRALAQASKLLRATLGLSAASPIAPPTVDTQLAGGQDSLPLDVAAYQAALNTLQAADNLNLLCIPPDDRIGDVDPQVLTAALDLANSKRGILLVDARTSWVDAASAKSNLPNLITTINGPKARNAAVFFPRVVQPDPLRGGQLDTFAPCGIIAGIIASTDAQRGVWKAPAGLDAGISGIQRLAVKLTDADSGALNPLGINCLRSFPASGPVVWGARTMRGSDVLGDEYKYLSVRRLALYIEESLYRGIQWAVFEPNDETLWAQLRLNVGVFMQGLFRKGAFKGASQSDAFFVKCDKDTTIQADIDRGIVNVLVGFAPVKPAEFVMIKLQQMAGQNA